MGIFNTYKEAVLANGSAEVIYLSYDNSEFYTGGPRLDEPFVRLARPADYLETLESFLASGKRLVSGDLYIAESGVVRKVGFDGGIAHDMNRPSVDIDRRTFILQAAADQVETPEEKEALDSIDTTPQQVESLSGSEKPNNSEWKNGDKVSLDRMLGVFVGLHPDDHELCYVMEDGIDNPVLWHTNRLSKPETPAEREERERLEAAYDLFVTATEKPAFDFDEFVKLSFVDSYLRIVDKTGYRKK